MAGYYRHVRRRAPLRVTLVLLGMSVAVPSARAERARVGLADATVGGRGEAAVAALRARPEPRRDLVLPRDTARAALEAPMAAEAGEEGGAPAEGTPRPRTTQLVRAARDAYSRFDYDGALERLRQAELAFATTPPGPELTQLLVDVNLLAGVIWVDRGDLPRALDAFRVVRRLDPERKALDPGSYRPKAVSLYAQAASPPEGRKSRLSVVTEPPGAEVWIDGQPAGTAPLALGLEAGPHYVSAVTEGSAPRLEKPLLRAGEDSRVSLLLARLAPEERARQARAALAAERVPWERGAAVLAVSASLDFLIVVRAPAGSSVQAALFDARAGKLGAWMPATPVEPVLAALAVELAPPAPATPLVTTSQGGGDPSPRAAAPWYRSWWVVPPILAVGAAAALGTLWMIDRERTTTYSLDRWCFGTTCEQ
jgi:hypothetical protein